MHIYVSIYICTYTSVQREGERQKLVYFMKHAEMYTYIYIYIYIFVFGLCIVWLVCRTIDVDFRLMEDTTVPFNVFCRYDVVQMQPNMFMLYSYANHRIRSQLSLSSVIWAVFLSFLDLVVAPGWAM